MVKWDYAAIVGHNIGSESEIWYLMRGRKGSQQAWRWTFHPDHPKSQGEALYHAPDVLLLVSKAGKDGWEITGGIGNSAGRP